MGLLSADEIVYAGGKYAIDNRNQDYYLKGVDSNYWWTMSPGHWDQSDEAYILLSSGVSNGKTHETHYFRPVITLSPSVIATGLGTSTSPYEIVID